MRLKTTYYERVGVFLDDGLDDFLDFLWFSSYLIALSCYYSVTRSVNSKYLFNTLSDLSGYIINWVTCCDWS